MKRTATEHQSVIPLKLRFLAAIKVLKAAVTHPLTPATLIIDGEHGTVEVIPQQRHHHDEVSHQHA